MGWILTSVNERASKNKVAFFYNNNRKKQHDDASKKFLKSFLKKLLTKENAGDIMMRLTC